MNPEVIKLIFRAFTIERWNDLPRPVKFIELDKQAHKFIIAYLISFFEKNVDYYKLINLGIANLLYRAVLTDLKSPVYHFLRKKRGKELDDFVINKLKDKIDDEMIEYLKILNNDNSIENRIHSAASFIATKWEFEIIYNTASFIYGMNEIKKNIENELEDFYNLEGVRILSLKRKSYDFISLCGNLRFQKRWANTPRVPETSVLGHMLFVAVITYLLSKEAKLRKEKIINNFFTALFHDLPEALTRDIIAPVKHKVKGLDEILKQYEHMLIDEKILPLLPKKMQSIMNIYLKDEFKNKTFKNGDYEIIENIEKIKNIPNSIDGSMLKAADHFGAYVEAIMSVYYGIKSVELESAINDLEKLYEDKIIYNINLGKYFNRGFFK
ncbi:putative hydrolases of HD superfamily [Lebetimonas natsushimae]|uniref:Putative hydrolases of HD superfamily n=1 Tax=Lebetimonas natsushimae TaxID=1936991 RepID=A0A292YCX4_9BACT|nr:HD domain-containing protein [Lebetimonas natsushimae]GAX87558.1 putative hydrolases of HD superfamily [Lebetimonas natsushimae]